MKLKTHARLGIPMLVACLTQSFTTTTLADDIAIDTELEFSSIASAHGRLALNVDYKPVECDGYVYFTAYDNDDDRDYLFAWDGNSVRHVTNGTFGDYYAGRPSAIGDGTACKVYVEAAVDFGTPSENETLLEVDRSGSNFTITEKTVPGVSRIVDVFAYGSYVYVRENIASGKKIVRYNPNSGAATVLQSGPVSESQLLLGGAGNYFYYAAGIGGRENLYSYRASTDTSLGLRHGTLRAPRMLVELNGHAYFRGTSDSGGTELWRSDGTNHDTNSLNIFSGSKSSYPRHITVVKNKLFFRVWDNGAQYLYSGSLNPNGVVTKSELKEIKWSLISWIQNVGDTVMFTTYGGEGQPGMSRSDGSGYGTAKITSDELYPIGIVSGKILALQPGSNSENLMVSNNDLPTNVAWAGLRASYYGIQSAKGNPDVVVGGVVKGFCGDANSGCDPEYDFPTPYQWEDGAKAVASYFPASDTQSTLVWIASRPRVDIGNDVDPSDPDDPEDPDDRKGGGAIMQMDRPSGVTFHNKIEFNGDVAGQDRDYHEAYLDHYDQAGVKLWVQLETGHAPLHDVGTNKGLLTAVLDYFIRENQQAGNSIHESVIGIGVDVEWLNNAQEGDSLKGHIRAGREARVAQWYKQIHDADPDLMMFLKHWIINDPDDPGSPQVMPNPATLATELSNLGLPASSMQKIMFINDSQGFLHDNPGPPSQAWNTMITEFVSTWANHYSASPVGYQILYPNDFDSFDDPSAGWLTFLDEESKDFGWSDNPGADGQDSIPPGERWKLTQKWGEELAKAVAGLGHGQQVGLFNVDFRARMLYPNDRDNEGDGIFEWERYRDGPSGPNLLDNGDFSSGFDSWYAWDTYWDDWASGHIYEDSGHVHADVWNDGDNPWSVAFAQITELTKDETYTVTFRAKSNFVRDIQVVVGMNEDPWTPYSGEQNFTIGTDWQTYSFTFTMNHPDDEWTQFEFDLGEPQSGANVSGSHVDIDDVVLVKH